MTRLSHHIKETHPLFQRYIATYTTACGITRPWYAKDADEDSDIYWSIMFVTCEECLELGGMELLRLRALTISL